MNYLINRNKDLMIRQGVRIIPETVSGCYRNMHAFSILENRMCFLLFNSELSNKKPPLCFPLNYIITNTSIKGYLTAEPYVPGYTKDSICY